MKINELLNESKRLDEAGATTLAARALSKVFGGGAKGAANSIGAGSNSRIINQVAARLAGGGTVTVDDIMRAGKVSREEATKLLAKATKKSASTIRTAAYQADIAGIGATAGAVKKWTGMLINAGLTGAYYWMFYEPLRDYMNNIEEAEKMLQAGGGTDPTPEDFEAYRRSQMSTLIGRWATVWASSKLAKLPFSIVSKLVKELSPSLAGGISTLGKAGQVYLMSKMNSPENATTIATWMSGPIASQFIGGAGVAAENAIRSWIPGAKEYEQSTASGGQSTADGSAETDQETDTDNTAPADDKTTEKKPWKPEEWEYYSPGIYKNKKTNELDRRENYL